MFSKIYLQCISLHGSFLKISFVNQVALRTSVRCNEITCVWHFSYLSSSCSYTPSAFPDTAVGGTEPFPEHKHGALNTPVQPLAWCHTSSKPHTAWMAWGSGAPRWTSCIRQCTRVSTRNLLDLLKLTHTSVTLLRTTSHYYTCAKQHSLLFKHSSNILRKDNATISILVLLFLKWISCKGNQSSAY